MFSQIGQTFGGVLLTEQEYKRVENAYANVALAFLTESGITALRVSGLENSRSCLTSFAGFYDGSFRAVSKRTMDLFTSVGTTTCILEFPVVALPLSKEPQNVASTRRRVHFAISRGD
jgi:hypothetical protein